MTSLVSFGVPVTRLSPSRGYNLQRVPVTCENGEYRRIEGLAIDDFSRIMMDKTLVELQEEQAGVAGLIAG